MATLLNLRQRMPGARDEENWMRRTHAGDVDILLLLQRTDLGNEILLERADLGHEEVQFPAA